MEKTSTWDEIPTPEARKVEPVKKKKREYRLAKGMGLKIPGLDLMITDANVNDPNVIQIITNVEARTGRSYFGTAIVEK